jgi:hypothetical protein
MRLSQEFGFNLVLRIREATIEMICMYQDRRMNEKTDKL